MTWHPPADLTPSKARKAAERVAKQWELSLKSDVQEEQDTPPLFPVFAPSRSDDFVSFVNDIWFPLEIEGSNRKPKTVFSYKSYLKIETAYFKGRTIQEITSIDIIVLSKFSNNSGGRCVIHLPLSNKRKRLPSLECYAIMLIILVNPCCNRYLNQI